MVIQKIICNRCGKDCNGGSFSVSPTPDDDTWQIDIAAAAHPTWERHYCGKECLMRSLNDMVDKIADGRAWEEARAQLKNEVMHD